MPPEQGPASEGEVAASFDGILAILADAKRRQILRRLRDEESLSVTTLCADLAADDEWPDDTASVRTGLEHTHLSKLAKAGLVSLDDGTVHLEHCPRAVATVLDVDPTAGAGERTEDAVTPTPNRDPRQSAVQELGEQKRRFSTLVSNLPGVVYRCQNERVRPMSFVSEGCRELTGYDPDALESGTVSWGEDVVHPDDRADVWETVQTSLDEHEQFEITYRIEGADGTVRWVWEQGRGIFEQGTVEAIEGFITDITEQKQRERNLEAVFDGTYQFIGLLETDGTVLEVNEAALEFGGVSREEVIGALAWETPWWQIDDETPQRLREAVGEASDGEFVRYQVTIQGDDRTATIDFSLRPVRADDGTVELLVAEGRDITERVRRERQLETLNEVSTRLVEAESPTAVCDVAVEAAQETLGLELASIELFDEGSGKLQPAARTDAVDELVGDRPLFAADEGKSWEVFVEQDGAIDRGLTAPTDDEGTPLDSTIVLPLGRHGVLITGSTEADAFGETEVDLARILAAHIEASLDSVDRETQLRNRTETLAEKNERLSRLNELNDVIRDLLQSLIGASNREEIQRSACQSLAAVDSYRFAWIGSPSHADDGIEPTARAGVEDGYLDAITDSIGEPACRAAREGEVTVVDQLHADPPFEPWRKAALGRGYQSAITVPLQYEDAYYGVLAVYAGQPGQFDGVERSVLVELGEAISYAITAAERKQALISEESLELEFSLREPDTPLLRCVRAVDCEFVFEGGVREAENGFSVFVTLRGRQRDSLPDVCRREPDVSDVRPVVERDDETLYECTLTGDGLLATVFSHGGIPQRLTTSDGDATLVVELPASRDVREFAATITASFPSTSLVAHRQRDQTTETTVGFRQELEDRLTERNLEVAKTAYYSGFFEWPRENAGQDVAEALDITQPTFNRHLRTAEKTIFELLFDEMRSE